MNDFTKEELITLNSWAASKIDCVGLVDFVGTPERELQRKIIAMIDNYCEHENLARDTGRRMHICNDCGVPL